MNGLCSVRARPCGPASAKARPVGLAAGTCVNARGLAIAPVATGWDERSTGRAKCCAATLGVWMAGRAICGGMCGVMCGAEMCGVAMCGMCGVEKCGVDICGAKCGTDRCGADMCGAKWGAEKLGAKCGAENA